MNVFLCFLGLERLNPQAKSFDVSTESVCKSQTNLNVQKIRQNSCSNDEKQETLPLALNTTLPRNYKHKTDVIMSAQVEEKLLKKCHQCCKSTKVNLNPFYFVNSTPKFSKSTPELMNIGVKNQQELSKRINRKCNDYVHLNPDKSTDNLFDRPDDDKRIFFQI